MLICNLFFTWFRKHQTSYIVFSIDPVEITYIFHVIKLLYFNEKYEEEAI